ncbi:MAG: hypothetical protein G01um101416_1094 [Microgenomates group bacterium Gr01-1014_16]|nr:MAG: hypothetical protein G01um101416_1094 [Microgenomates group bacterium Gr01-1014_16]
MRFSINRRRSERAGGSCGGGLQIVGSNVILASLRGSGSLT